MKNNITENNSINGYGAILKDYLECYNISQVEFANRLDIRPEYLNKILNDNIDISPEMIIAISLLTDVDASFILKVENDKKIKRYLYDKYGNDLGKFLKQFNINELEKNNWVTFNHKSDDYQNAIDILKFLKIRNFDAMDKLLENIMYKKKDDSDKTKILLWIAKCDEISKLQDVKQYSMDNLNNILNFLKKECLNKVDYNLLIKVFNENGLYLVINDALKGTKIRGCAKVKGDKPAIYLTKLYKDKASFYFALYHELGHIKYSYSKAKKNYIIDSDEVLEGQADKFALECMIDSKSWEDIINSKDLKNECINVSKKNNIPLCFIVRNLAYNNYISYNDEFYLKNIEKIN